MRRLRVALLRRLNSHAADTIAAQQRAIGRRNEMIGRLIRKVAELTAHAHVAEVRALEAERERDEWRQRANVLTRKAVNR